jgi:hypothetical protein
MRLHAPIAQSVRAMVGAQRSACQPAWSVESAELVREAAVK